MGYCALMDRDGVGVHKLAKKNEADIYGLLIKCEVKMAVFWPIRKKKERGQYLAILTEQARSKKSFIIWLLGKFFLRDTAGSPNPTR